MVNASNGLAVYIDVETSDSREALCHKDRVSNIVVLNRETTFVKTERGVSIRADTTDPWPPTVATLREPSAGGFRAIRIGLVRRLILYSNERRIKGNVWSPFWRRRPMRA